MILMNLVFQMRSLLQCGKGFSVLMDVEGLLSAFMAVCRERYDVVSSAVLLLDDLDPNNVFYRVRAYHGLSSNYKKPNGDVEELLLFRIPADQGLLWQVVGQGEVFSVLDMRGDARFSTAFKRCGLDVLGSHIWVPLAQGGKVLGILTLGPCQDGTVVPESEYGFLQEIASVAATNIDSTSSAVGRTCSARPSTRGRRTTRPSGCRRCCRPAPTGSPPPRGRRASARARSV